jgi:hypothetical protein
VETLLNIPTAGDALAAMARRTDDPVRDPVLAAREAVKRKLQTLPHPARMVAVLEGEEDDSALGRIFGEELPSGLVLESAGGRFLPRASQRRCLGIVRATHKPASR